MQDAPVILREDVTVSLDKGLITELIGIAEDRQITLSVLIRDILGSFSRSLESGTDWTRSGGGIGDAHASTGSVPEGSDHQVSLLASQVSSHDQRIAVLEQRLMQLESGSIPYPVPMQQSPLALPGSPFPQVSAPGIASVIDSDGPLAGSVSDDALVKIRRPVAPVMTSVDVNSIGRINPSQVYSQTEAAALLSVSISTLRKYVKEGRIPSQKVGRSTVFTGRDLLAFLDATR